MKMNIGTPFGLAFASGINAYLPLLSFAIAARWLHLYKVNANFAFITSNWFLMALIILTLVDFVADNPGLTLFHCHQQLHMDFGFMALFDYV